MRAIMFRQRATLEAQLTSAKQIDARARVVDARGIARVLDADDWLLIRAADVHGLAGGAAVEHEDVRVDLDDGGAASATYRGQPISLTRLELRLLGELVRARGKAVSRETLLRECWDVRATGDYTKIEAAACRLRKKLCASTHLYIHMDRGVGYRLAPRVLQQAGRPQRGRRILVAEPDTLLRRALVKHLRDYVVDTATTVARTRRLLENRRYAAAFIAATLRDGSSLSMLPTPTTTLMMVDDEETAARALRLGATACWQKADDDPAALRNFVRSAIESEIEERASS